MEKKLKILITDDSQLLRKKLRAELEGLGCEVIEAENGKEAVMKDLQEKPDGIFLDIVMPEVGGIEALQVIREVNPEIPVIMLSSAGTPQKLMETLKMGALDFIQKPDWAYRCREENFTTSFLKMLETASMARLPQPAVKKTKQQQEQQKEALDIVERIAKKETSHMKGSRIVAIASSTGGPRALQSVIPSLSAQLNAPVVLVQHMPPGFTMSLAQRLDHLSKIKVVEAQEGQRLENGCVYLAKSGLHLNLVAKGKDTVVHYSEEPTREGVRPSANYMYESLAECGYDEVICVVMTGMGADATEGIKHLKKKKKVYVITQDGDSCVVNGMPKSVVKAGLSDQSVDLPLIAQEIILHVGVK